MTMTNRMQAGDGSSTDMGQGRRRGGDHLSECTALPRALGPEQPRAHVPVQLALLPGVLPRPVPVRRRRPAPLAGTTGRTIADFERRVQALGAAAKTARDYASQLRTLVRIAAELGHRSTDLLTLFGDPWLLGHALSYPRKLEGEGEYSGYATDGRRHAARKFAIVFAREIEARHGEPAETLLDRALRTVYRRVGTVDKSPMPQPRRRGGTVLRPGELERLLEVVGQQPGVEGRRDAAAMRIMAETGCRIDALRRLDGKDCYEEADGHIRLPLHAKGRRDPAEYVLSLRASSALRAYIEAYNAMAPRLGVPHRIGPETAGPIWRSRRGVVTCGTWRAVLTRACTAAGLPRLRPHDLRRTFATQAESRIGRHQAALAGWWEGTGTMDRHYISPRPETTDDKIRALGDDAHTTSAVPSLAHVGAGEPLGGVA
jgi:integrase